MGSIRGLEGLSEARAGEKARRKLKASKVGEEVTSSASDFGVRGRNGHLGRGECRRKERDWQGEFPPVASLLQSIGGKRMEGGHLLRTRRLWSGLGTATVGAGEGC